MKPRKLFLTLASIMAVIGFVNFFYFLAESSRLGGDALNGFIKNGQYFVGDHGIYKVVDKRAWEINRIHGISVFVTHPLAILSSFYILTTTIFPRLIYKRDIEIIKTKHANKKLTNPLMEFKASGKVGSLSVHGPLLNIKVYRDGLTIKPIFMPLFLITKEEITDIKQKNLFFRNITEIHHSSIDITTPITLIIDINTSNKLIEILS